MRHRSVGIALVVGLAVVACWSGAGASRAATRRRAAPVWVLTQNLLHGLFCPDDSDFCRAPARVQIFTERVEAAGCPDLIGLQEIATRLEALVTAAVPTLCHGSYRIAWQGAVSPDRVMVLTRLPIVEQGYLDIANVPWEAYWVRVRSAQGPVDFLTAHFASSSNNPLCTAALCPPVCPVGIRTNECHGIEVVDFFSRRRGAALTVVGGDLNAHPDEPAVEHLRDAGFVDTWTNSGHRECDPSTHVGCTSGGTQPEPYVGIDTRAGPGFDERVDYVLARPGKGCRLRAHDTAFAATPRATPLDGMWWQADHAGVLATLRCG